MFFFEWPLKTGFTVCISLEQRAQARGDLGRNSHPNLAHFGRLIDMPSFIWAMLSYSFSYYDIKAGGAQWLSGSVLDSRPRGWGFEPQQRRCIVSLSKTHLSLLNTGSTQEDLSQHN